MTTLIKTSSRRHLSEIIWMLDHNFSTIKRYKQVAFPTQKVEECTQCRPNQTLT